MHKSTSDRPQNLNLSGFFEFADCETQIVSEELFATLFQMQVEVGNKSNDDCFLFCCRGVLREATSATVSC